MLALVRRLRARHNVLLGNRGCSSGGRFHVVDRAYDSMAVGAENLAIIQESLSAAGIEYVTVPSADAFRSTVVVRRESSASIASTLSELTGTDGWFVDRQIAQILPSAFTGSSRFEQKRGVVAYIAGRRCITRRGVTLSNHREFVSIQVWTSVSSAAGGGEVADGCSGRLFSSPSHEKSIVSSLSTSQWNDAQTSPGHFLELGGPLLMQVTEPIDVVYTWVDGSDPLWLERKQAALSWTDVSAFHESAASPSRYSSRDELKYSLRSVEMYANWVRHIYIVTDGQIPPWVDAAHSKITIVDHKEIFSDCEGLPVFNSHAIESQLHRIPGLSEKYLYLNDDIFFARPVSPTLFFTSSGLSKFFPSQETLDLDRASEIDMPVAAAAKNNREYMLGESGRVLTNKFKHTPHAQIRSILEQFEEDEPRLFNRILNSRFRHPDDLSIASSLYHYLAYVKGKAVEGRIKYAYVDIGRSDTAFRLRRLGNRRDLDVFCLNLTAASKASADENDRVVEDFLNERFPVPSSFELL